MSNTQKNQAEMQKISQPYTQGHKFRWYHPDVSMEKVHAIISRCHVAVPIAQTLVRRGFDTPEKVLNYLCMTNEIVADSRQLKGAEATVARLRKAIDAGEKILIFGDYDVDGITSSAIMLVSMLPLGATINYFLPNRARDGYGLSSKFVKKAHENGYRLIITVDNGITAFEPALLAKELGIDLIITDHHQPHDHVPEADIIVNPHQDDCPYPYKDFAGVGVIFKIMSLLYEQLGLSLPDKAYELLMLGTVADVVPLVNENRYWVQYGLQKVNNELSRAMHTLLHNGRASLKSRIDSLDIGYAIAPQLNALGRLDDPRDGVRFLISNDSDEVLRIGTILKNINEERKRVDRSIYDEIEGAILSKQINLDTDNVVMAANTGWPAGVIGLVAGRIMNKFGRPTFLFHKTKDGLLKGSCRSIQTFNVFNALNENKDLLISFGGHALAAGLALPEANLEKLKERLEEKIAATLTEDDLAQKIMPDAYVTLPEVTHQLVNDLRKLEPFGNSNEQPLFWVKNVTLLKQPQLLKDQHVKCLLFSDGIIKPIMFFNRPELYSLLCDLVEVEFSVAAHVVVNEWNQRVSIELQGVDIAVGVYDDYHN